MSYETQPEPYFGSDPQFTEHKQGRFVVQTVAEQQQLQTQQQFELPQDLSDKWAAFAASNRAFSVLTNEVAFGD